MIRQHLAQSTLRSEPHFRWRGGEISRLEALSDAVFAFAITLLVVSLEVPTSFHELVVSMRGFLAFAICFTLLYVIWHAHYIFFRRYGIEDTVTSVLNAVLLFVVLFYIYPLKFLFTFLVGIMFGVDTGVQAESMIAGQEVSTLMIVYSLGFLAIFSVLFLMYWRAYRMRDKLGLDNVEQLCTRTSINMYLIYMIFALISIALAATGNFFLVAMAGWIYGLLGIVQGVNGVRMGRKIRSAIEARDSKEVMDVTG